MKMINKINILFYFYLNTLLFKLSRGFSLFSIFYFCFVFFVSLMHTSTLSLTFEYVYSFIHFLSLTCVYMRV